MTLAEIIPGKEVGKLATQVLVWPALFGSETIVSVLDPQVTTGSVRGPGTSGGAGQTAWPGVFLQRPLRRHTSE